MQGTPLLVTLFSHIQYILFYNIITLSNKSFKNGAFISNKLLLGLYPIQRRMWKAVADLIFQKGRWPGRPWRGDCKLWEDIVYEFIAQGVLDRKREWLATLVTPGSATEKGAIPSRYSTIVLWL